MMQIETFVVTKTHCAYCQRYLQAEKNNSAEIDSSNLSIFCGESFICGE